MQAAKARPCSPEQLANADLACKMFTALPEDRQRTAAMMANVFLEGWMARELLSNTPPNVPTPPAAPTAAQTRV